jgi:UDP-N-acetylmuramyl pentapeptide phosphotransferase/UDP-N-acetylglucosamine-1-phosphate transferase
VTGRAPPTGRDRRGSGTVAAVAVAAGVAGAVAHLAHRRLTATVRSPRWQRTNHAGDPVTLLEGPAYVAGAVAGASVAGPAGVVAALGSGAFGAIDDLAGDGGSKGLKGHLGAAARGRVTTGLVKVVGIGATGLLAAVLADRHRDDLRPVDTLVGGAVVAGAANLVNLLDLRPGRALKATVIAAVPLLLPPGRQGSLPGAAAAGAALGVLRPDLAGTAMLGDTGANAAGALLGTALVSSTGRPGRVVAVSALAALTLASERVSFTRVIESTPGLRELDAWGRPAR